MWPVWLICTVAGVVGLIVVVLTFALTFSIQQKKFYQYIDKQLWLNDLTVGKPFAKSPIMLEAQFPTTRCDQQRLWRAFHTQMKPRRLMRSTSLHGRTDTSSFGQDVDIGIPLLTRTNHLARLTGSPLRQNGDIANPRCRNQRLFGFGRDAGPSTSIERVDSSRNSSMSEVASVPGEADQSSMSQDRMDTIPSSVVLPELDSAGLRDSRLPSENDSTTRSAISNNVSRSAIHWPLGVTSIEESAHKRSPGSRSDPKQCSSSVDDTVNSTITQKQRDTTKSRQRPISEQLTLDASADIRRPKSLALVDPISPSQLDFFKQSGIDTTPRVKQHENRSSYAEKSDKSEKRWSEQSVSKRVNSGFTGPPGRHSMYVWGSDEKIEVPCVHPGQVRSKGYSLYPRAGPRALARTQRPQSAVLPMRGRGDGHTKGHKRQNCIRISGISMQPGVRPFGNHPRGPVRSSNIHRSLSRPSSQNSTSSTTQTFRQDTKHELMVPDTRKSWNFDIFVDDTPYTPQRGLATHQEEDEEDENSYILKSTMSDTHHDSPILPSPAYTPAGLFPRRQKIQGPRSLGGRPHSPIRRLPSAATKQSLDLRKSIMLLRCMNSEDLMLDAEQENLYRNLGINRHSHRSSRTSMDGMYALRTHTPSPLSSRPLTPTKDMSISRSAISVWEDTSVHEEPDPTERQQTTVLNETQPAASIADSPTIPDKFTAEDIENQSGGDIVSANNKTSAACETPRAKSHVLPRLWETPGSLYDQEGFLKENM